MKTSGIITFILLITLSSYSQNKAKIIGVIKGIGNTKIYLENKPDGITNAFVPIIHDSVYSKNDSFEFNIKFNEVNLYSIQYPGYNGWLPFIIDNGIIKISAIKDLIYKGEVTGSHQNDIYKNYKRNILNPFYDDNRCYFDSTDKYRNVDTSKFNYFNNIIKKVWKDFLDQQKKFIRDNPDSYTALLLVYRNLKSFDKDTLSYYFNLLSYRFQNHSLAIDIKYRITGFSKNVAVGATIPDFNLTDKDGKSISLYNIHSKYKLVNFWASWCGPCLAEIPTLQSIDSVYKNIAIVSFSIDTKKEQWLQALQQNKIPWYSFSDFKGTSGKFANYFSVHEIPLLILLNEKNEIIKYNISPMELVKFLNNNRRHGL
jgi:thiol-disulfide isomerase/thioredoxin